MLRRIALACACVGVLSACSSGEQVVQVAEVEPSTLERVESPITASSAPPTSPPPTSSAPSSTNVVVPAPAGQCDEAAFDGIAGLEFGAAYEVAGGKLAGLCFGADDGVLLDAWAKLTTVVPEGQLSDLAVFAAYAPVSAGESDTLAFVQPVNEDATQFMMAVNTVAAVDDTNELWLTLTHEFSHVFSGVATQLDRTVGSEAGCVTYDNGEGCYLKDSLMAQWVARFWTPEMLEQIDPTGTDQEAAMALCAVDPSFVGPYAASNPDEDFAESFAAMVMRVEVDTPEQQEKIDWLAAQPGLVEFRERAVAAGIGPLPNNFGGCGDG